MCIFAKPLMHILCALGIWVFILVLVLMEQNNFMTLRIDQVKTYTLRKVPQKWDLTYSQIVSNLNIIWTAADDRVCFAASGSVGTCAAKRQQVVTSVRQSLSCDQYRSAFCSCVNQLLQPVADDLVNFFPIANGSFFFTSKNVNGTLPTILNGIDACHYLHHGTFIAQQTGDTWLRRTHLLFILLNHHHRKRRLPIHCSASVPCHLFLRVQQGHQGHFPSDLALHRDNNCHLH